MYCGHQLMARADEAIRLAEQERLREQEGRRQLRGDRPRIEPVPPEVAQEVFGRDQAEFEAKLATGEIALVAVSPLGIAMELPPPRRQMVASAEQQPAKCESHLWEFDAGNFQRRHCTRPGCQARQRFEWRPQSLTQQGQWVDEVPIQQKRTKGTKKKR